MSGFLVILLGVPVLAALLGVALFLEYLCCDRKNQALDSLDRWAADYKDVREDVLRDWLDRRQK